MDRRTTQPGQTRGCYRLLLAVIFGLGSPLPLAFGHTPTPVQSQDRQERLETTGVAPDFALYDQHGRTRTLRQFRGQLVVLSFIYTSCPDVCDLLTAKLTALQRHLRGQDEVFFLTLTTDPETDTPAVLKAYAQRFKADLRTWAFLTGPRSDLEPIWSAYNLTVSKQLSRLIRTITQPAKPWVVNHTFRTFLIDRDGVIRVMYNGFVWSEADVLHDLKRLQAPGQRPSQERTMP